MRISRAMVLGALLAGPAAAGQVRLDSLSAPTVPEQLALPLPAVPEISAGLSEVNPEKLKASRPTDAPTMGASMPSVPSGQPERQAAGTGTASAEQQKSVSGALFENAARPGGDGSASVFAGGGSEGPRLIPRTLREKVNERYHFRRLWLQNMYWYTITHITGMWPRYHAKIIVAQAKGAALPVSSHRRFFSYMRVMGQTGKFHVLGFAPRDDKSVLREARDTFKKYFNSIEVGPEEDSAFDRFLDRATRYNAAQRNNTNLRKHVRDAMIQASVTPVEQLAGYFNGLLREDARQQTDAFQHGGGQQKTLEAFRKAVLDTIAEEDPAAKDRVVGVVLLGSFASGGATSRSDLDIELLTANGHAARVKDFKKRLTDRWRAAGQHKVHPVSVKDFPDPPYRAVIDRIHYLDYLVISPSSNIVDALARKPGEPPAFTASEQMSPWSPLLRKVQYLTVYWTTVWSDLKALFA